MTYSEDDEAPLDPVLERVQRKLRRLMLIGGLTMALGIAAVLAVMVYRISTLDDNKAATGAAVAELTLPAGSRLVSSALDGDRLLMVYEHDGGTLALVIDHKAGRVVSRTELPGR